MPTPTHARGSASQEGPRRPDLLCGPFLGTRPRPPRTFFSLVFRGSCCTTSAKPASSCSWPAPPPRQSSAFPSVATLSTWKRWLWRGSGSQSTWDSRVRGQGREGCLTPGHPPPPSKTRCHPHPRAAVEGSQVPPQPQRDARTRWHGPLGATREEAGKGPGPGGVTPAPRATSMQCQRQTSNRQLPGDLPWLCQLHALALAPTPCRLRKPAHNPQGLAERSRRDGPDRP